ncbi:HD domain-containing protein [Dubosiella newyorkensis]|uniref:HD domain-containing protein n=1 Tax=Dubosiella newyorkensis TaxID=1862672 RepID=UPI00272F1C54|nr:reverse transcriptase domain-containing protein [Dubosiella newyorkensis]
MMKVKNNDQVFIDEICNKANIYTAYCYIKNNTQNSELRFPQEFEYFEENLDICIEKIYDRLKNRFEGTKESLELHKIDYILKYKNIGKEKIDYRPLVKLSLDDEILIQSIINVIAEDLRNFLPQENFGIQLSDKRDRDHFYKNWQTQYKKFVNYQKKCIEEKTSYYSVFEYDITQYYPSISQRRLILLLINLLGINENSIIASVLDEIIFYYKKDQITERTRISFEYYHGNNVPEDLGLPQGPLYSAFLSSIFSYNVFKNIKKSILDECNVEVEIVAYVDDGRIFFKEECPLEPDKLIELVEEEYTNLNKINKNDKPNKIKVNRDKTCLIKVYEESVTDILSFLIHSISGINASITPDFEIDETLISTLEESHDNLKQSLKKLSNMAHSKEDQYDKTKIKKEAKTYLKRAASFKTRKILNDSNFKKIVNEALPVLTKKDDIQDTNLEFLDHINLSLINFYYVILNLFKGCETSEQVKYLCGRIKEYREGYISLFHTKSGTGFEYYDIQLLKILYELELDKDIKELYEIIAHEVDDNSIVYPYLYAYYKASWISKLNFKGFIDQKKNIDGIGYFDYIVTHYVEKPAIINLVEENKLYDSFEMDQIDLVKFMENKKFIDKHNFIYHEKLNEVNNGENNNKELFRLNSSSLTDSEKKSILFTIFEFWKKIFDEDGQIERYYFEFDNYYIYKNGNELNILILNNTSNLYEQIEYQYHRFPVKEVLFNFFALVFNIDENLLITKKMKPVEFWQYRIMAYLQNVSGWMRMNNFLDMLIDVRDNIDILSNIVDSNYELIRKIVDVELKDAHDKDIILQLHYFVSCVWKNGSKDLPFYTLHNHEHSLELIKNYALMSQRTLNNLSLDNDEKFLLFAACYLHDLGMLKGATEDELMNIENKSVYDYYKNIKVIFENKKETAFKYSHLISRGQRIFQLTEKLNENIVRRTHSFRSKRFLLKDHVLPLNELERQLVGEISLNHGESLGEVYGKERKVDYRHHKVDIRKLSIWLRLLDLTDMTKSRVTQQVFGQYCSRMGEVSRYHWIRHLCIDDILFSVEYIKDENKSKKLTRNEDLNLGKIRFVIEIILNYVPPEEKINKKCKNKNCFKEIENGWICTKKRQTREDKKEEKCPFNNLRCAFLNDGYLLDEIDALNDFLHEYDQFIKFEVRFIRNKELINQEFKLKTATGNKTVSSIIKDFFN